MSIVHNYTMLYFLLFKLFILEKNIKNTLFVMLLASVACMSADAALFNINILVNHYF